MIAALRGTILFRDSTRVVVDVRGVGYEVAVSSPTLESLPLEGEVFFHIHTALRENSLELFGFTEPDEKSLFELLISVTGIGPRTAMTMLSGISVESFEQAVLRGDIRKLTTIPGIGKKSAERIVLELKEKIKKRGIRRVSALGLGVHASLEEDLVSSLLNLGYKEREAGAAAAKVLSTAAAGLTLTDAVKAALKELAK